jgi:ferredoxin
VSGVRIEADRTRCLAIGNCALTAPEVFDQDDDGTVLVLDPAPPAAEHERVRAAAELCPAAAIRLRGDDV